MEASKAVSTKKKHPGGAPRKWKSVEAMQKAIETYFAKCESRVRVEIVGPPNNRQAMSVLNPEPPTVLGLALSLDLTSEGLREYGERPEFTATVQKAKARIAATIERRMMDGDGWGPGHIFSLKNNFGWKDYQTIEATGKGGGPILIILGDAKP